MLKYGLGDVVKFKFYRNGKCYAKHLKGEIIFINIHKGFYTFDIDVCGEVYENVPLENIKKGIVVYKFKKGQLVNSFHYNENMKTSSFETGFFVKFVSEKNAIVNFGGSKREVLVSGLEMVDNEIYHVGTTQTRKKLSTILRYGLKISKTRKFHRINLKSIGLNHNGILEVLCEDSIKWHFAPASSVVVQY